MSFHLSDKSAQKDRETGLTAPERKKAVMAVEDFLQGRNHLPMALRNALKQLIPELRD